MLKTTAHIARRRNRRNANGAFGLGTTTPSHAWDFVNNKARFNSINYGVLANTPGWSFTRASTGYAQTSAGALTAFASGELRRTDKGVLIEGAGTNLCLQSQTFDNASWLKALNLAVTVTANQGAAPDGTTTADLITATAGTGFPYVAQAITGVDGATYTYSVYVKYTNSDYVWFNAPTDSFVSVFRFSTATFTTTASGVTTTVTALANGWYRVSLTRALSGTTSMRCGVGIGTAAGATNGTFAGTETVLAWGAQIEASAFASSYIPTTTGSATRAADSLTVTGVTGLDYPLSLYAEFERAVDTGAVEVVFSVDATAAEVAELRVSNGDLATIISRTGSVQQANITVSGAIAVGNVTKVAGRVATNDVQIAKNGTLGTQDTSATNPTSPTRINFGIWAVGASDWSFGYLRRAALWTRALTDAELQAVTR